MYAKTHVVTTREGKQRNDMPTIGHVFHYLPHSVPLNRPSNNQVMRLTIGPYITATESLFIARP